MTANMKADFPAIVDWEDPIQFSCQKNFIITAGDASTWCDSLIPGNLNLDTCSGHAGSPKGGNDPIDVTVLTNKVGLRKEGGAFRTRAHVLGDIVHAKAGSCWR